MCTVIEIIPFDNVGQMALLLRQNKTAEVIDHAIVIEKCVRYEYDDRI